MKATRWHPAIALVAAAMVVSLPACSPALDAEGWMLESIPFRTQIVSPSEALVTDKVDVAFGMSTVTADGDGGFWSGSSGSWLHVGADGETLHRFNIDVEHPLHSIGHIAALSPTELVATRSTNRPHTVPGLAIIDMETLEFTDVPMRAEPDADGLGFGDFMFGGIAVHDGNAYVVRYQPVPLAYLDFEILRVDLDDGERTTLHRETLFIDDSPQAAPGLPSVDIDVDADGRVYVATPSYRLTLAPDGTELTRSPQTASHPVVAVSPDGRALWWGGVDERADTSWVIAGGSGEAREIIAARTECDDLRRQDSLRMTHAGEMQSLPFLCSPNAAAWTGDSWVVAIGGEGDGVLVRLTPPSTIR